MIKTRFAPSPTGYLHVGGARTALFNYLVAKQSGGKFVLRIEDTDQERNSRDAVETIYRSLSWLGLQHDEGDPGRGNEYYDNGPYTQSARLHIYKEYYEKLIQQGNAYRCYCTKEELDLLKAKYPKDKQFLFKYPGICKNRLDQPDLPYVVRFKNSKEQKQIQFQDKVYGKMEFKDSGINNSILVRADGFPVYNFGCAIDDMLMDINLVIRGRDHLQNTSQQIDILNVLNGKIPEYAHLPMLMANKTEKLSKRHGSVSVLEFRDEGYAPQGLLSYLVSLGWSYKNEELFTMDDLLEKFSLDAVNKSDGIFDPKKCKAINSKFLKKKARDTDIADGVLHCLRKYGESADAQDSRYITLKPWIKDYPNMKDMAEAALFYFKQDYAISTEHVALMKLEGQEKYLHILNMFIDKLPDLDMSSPTSISNEINLMLLQNNYNIAEVSKIIRIILTGTIKSIDLFSIIFLLGREKTLHRLEKGLKL